jgi:hypothetical protein
MTSKIGFCEVDLYLPGVMSLKEKRGMIKSMLVKMRKQFNVSAAEVEHHDTWQSATIAISTVSNSAKQSHRTLQTVIKWMESRYPDALISDHFTEIL